MGKQEQREEKTQEKPNIPETCVSGFDGDPEVLFAAFWKSYPRKEGKHGKYGAHAAFLSAIKRGDLEQMRAGLRRWRDHWHANQTGLQFIPYPATWLNGRRYLDQPLAGSVRGREFVDALKALQFDDDGRIIG